jgi:hypothetical protein
MQVNKKLKIGLTLKVGNVIDAFYTNGMNQNALYFYDLLVNIGYDVYFIVLPAIFENIKTNTYFIKYPKYKFLVNDETLFIFPFDIIVMLSFVLTREAMISFKAKNTKLVYYCCGNEYLDDVANIIYSKNDSVTSVKLNDDNTGLFNEIWLLPQHMNSNYHYSKILQRCKCVEIPCIWSPSLLQELSIHQKTKFEYKNHGKDKKVCIFEPNLSFIKWCLPPILICENAYRKMDKTGIKQVYSCNIDGNTGFNQKLFNEIVKTLDLVRDKKISIEKRYIAIELITKYADIVVSHQTENNLNYLWFDMAWYGYPVIHNGNLCKDIGYYYDGYDYETGGQILVDVIKNHDAGVTEYMERNRALLDRYSPTNKELQRKYKAIIENIA